MATSKSSLLRLAYPLIISFWMRSLFTFVDTLYASFLGDEAIAAIGVSIPFEFLLVATWVGVSTGLTSYLSRSVGQGDTRQFDQIIKLGRKIVVAAASIFLLIGIGIYFVAPYMNIAVKVQEGFQVYGSVLMIGSALTAFWSILPDSIVKAHHDTKSTMIAGLLSNFVNLALNSLFLFVFEWGLFGIAFSTVLGRLAGLVYALYRAHLLENKRRRKLETNPALQNHQRPLRRPLQALATLSVPAAIAYLLMSAEVAFVNFLLSHFPNSTAAIATYGIFYRVYLFFVMPIIAITVAQLPFVARYAAQGKFHLIHRSYREVLRLGAVYSVVIVGPLCYFFADPILAFLTQTQEVRELGRFAIQIVPLFSLISGPFMLSRPIFEGLQQGRPTVVMAILRYLVLAMPLAYLGSQLGPQIEMSSFAGLMSGLLTAVGLSSFAYFFWTRTLLTARDATATDQ